MDRECNKCIHHTSGMCSSWDCKMQTVDDVKKEAREKVIEEFRREAIKRFVDFDRLHGYPTVADCEDILNDVAEQLKGNKAAEEKEG